MSSPNVAVLEVFEMPIDNEVYNREGEGYGRKTTRRRARRAPRIGLTTDRPSHRSLKRPNDWPVHNAQLRKPTADRDAFQRYVCHTSKRMSCQTPGIRRGSEAQRRGKGDAQPAAGDLRPV